MKTKEQYVEQMLAGLGLEGKARQDHPVSNQAESEPVDVHGSTVIVRVTEYKGSEVEVYVSISLPKDGAVALTFIDCCAKAEKLEKNHHYEYCVGPRYRDQSQENFHKHTFCCCPWGGYSFYVSSQYYPKEEIDDAVRYAVELAGAFIRHLGEHATLRYWKPDDKEVVAKAEEILGNAALYESDCDREEKAHMIEDRNSFMKGWFMPFNDRGKGTFDTLWPSSIDYAAKSMGNEGSFEYAVASRLLVDPQFIAKARSACRIRQETVTRSW